MNPQERVEMLERALVIMAFALAFDEGETFEEIVAKQEEIISCAKVTAMEDMRILPPVQGDGSDGL